MKTRQYLFFICIFLSTSLSAAPNMVKAVKSELIALTEHARCMLCDYQNGKQVASLVEHYLDEAHYAHTKSCLSVEQHMSILASAEQFDDAVKVGNTMSIHLCFMNFSRVIMQMQQVVCSGTVAAVRKVSKKDCASVVDNNLHAVSSKKPVVQNAQDEVKISDLFSSADQKQFNDAIAALANPDQSAFDLLIENRGKIAMGLVTLYAMFAKAYDWPPYDKKPKPVKITWSMWLADQANQVGETVSMMGG